MNFIQIVLALLGTGTDVLEARSKLKAAKIDMQRAATIRAMESDAAWEQYAAQNAANSWLDEYWTLILSLPLFLSFVPGMDDVVSQGFENAGKSPEWYQWACLASISFAFGRKVIPKLSFSRKS